MNALLNPQNSFISLSSIYAGKSRKWTHSHIGTVIKVPAAHLDRRIGRSRKCLTLRAVLDSATIDQLGLSEWDIRNPALSSSYRSSELPKPNQTVLDAQARVCTGPTQTRPLNEEQASKVLDTILKSGKSTIYLG